MTDDTYGDDTYLDDEGSIYTDDGVAGAGAGVGGVGGGGRGERAARVSHAAVHRPNRRPAGPVLLHLPLNPAPPPPRLAQVMITRPKSPHNLTPLTPPHHRLALPR